MGPDMGADISVGLDPCHAAHGHGEGRPEDAASKIKGLHLKVVSPFSLSFHSVP